MAKLNHGEIRRLAAEAHDAKGLAYEIRPSDDRSFQALGQAVEMLADIVERLADELVRADV